VPEQLPNISDFIVSLPAGDFKLKDAITMLAKENVQLQAELVNARAAVPQNGIQPQGGGNNLIGQLLGIADKALDKLIPNAGGSSPIADRLLDIALQNFTLQNQYLTKQLFGNVQLPPSPPAVNP
jgi:hypothetical protein